jgi:hypothetical protein
VLLLLLLGHRLLQQLQLLRRGGSFQGCICLQHSPAALQQLRQGDLRDLEQHSIERPRLAFSAPACQQCEPPEAHVAESLVGRHARTR